MYRIAMQVCGPGIVWRSRTRAGHIRFGRSDAYPERPVFPTLRSPSCFPHYHSSNISSTSGSAQHKPSPTTESLTAADPSLMPPKFASREQEREFLKFRLAQAFRIFGKLGYDEGFAGHITVRDPIRPDCFWVNPFAKHFSLIQPSDLILADQSGAVQAAESGPSPHRILNKAAFMIHSAIHTARADVHCAAHSHSVYGRAFSTLGKELDMITQDSCAFYEDHGVYRKYGGVILDEEEGTRMVNALSSKKAVILQNHGILVATDSIEATLHFFIALEKSCQVQLMADAASTRAGGKPIKIPHEGAALAYGVVGSMRAGWLGGLTYFQVLEAQEGVSFNFGGKQY